MGFRMGKKIKESSTTAGSVAPVAQSMHTDKRSVVGQGIYGNKKGGSMFTGKKTNKKFANSAPVLESEDLEEGIFDIFTNKDNKKSKKVAVSTDDEAGKISFSDLGKNAMFDPNDKRVTDDQRMFYEFILSQKNKADSTDFINAINHYIRKYKEAGRKEGGSNPHNSGRLKVLNYFERQLAKPMPIKESDISEELIAKKLAQDFKSFKRPKDREISQRSRDREILPKTEDAKLPSSGSKLPTAGVGAISGTSTDQSPEKDSALSTAANIAGNTQLATSLAAPVLTKVGATAAGSLASRAVPGLGLVAGGLDAWRRAKEGDYTGAALSAGSGLAAMVPVVGTAASLGLTGAQVYRDYKREQEKAAQSGAPTQAVTKVAPIASTATKPAQSGSSNFKQAFAAARKGGSDTFTYKGKVYNTQLAEQALTEMKKIKPTIKQDKLSPHEKFKGSVKRAGYDMDAGANRLLKLLDKQAKERSERDSEDVNEWVSRREEFNPQPAVSTFESADNTVKTFRVTLVDRLTDEPKTITVKASSNEEAESKAEKQHSGYDVRGSRKISEGAKVDRMVKHIEKSERATGKDKKEAENIAWATANKRGYLDNKNKKKHVTEGRVKDIAMAIDELTHEGKTPGQIAKELDIPLMIVLKFKAQMDQMDKPVVSKGQLNEFDKEGFEQYTLYTGDHHKQYQVNDEKFKSIEDAIEEAEFLMDADPKSKMSVWTVQDMDNNIVWSHDPAEIADAIRSANKIKFLKPSKKDIDESHDSDEYDDESGMAHNQLENIARAVHGLGDTIQEGDNLPEWVQKKLTLAEDHLITIWNYLQSEKSDEIMEARDGDTNFGSTVGHGSWVVYDGSKVKRFKSREGAKAYAAKNGGKVASSEFYADNIQKQGVAEAVVIPSMPASNYVVNIEPKQKQEREAAKEKEASSQQFPLKEPIKEFAPTPDFGDGRRDDGEYMPLGEYADIIEQYLGRGYTREDRRGGAKHLPQVSVRFIPKDKSQDGLIIYSFIHPKRGEYSTHNTIVLKYDDQGMGHGKKGPSAVPKTQKQALKIAQLISGQQDISEAQQCPECGGAAYDNEMIAEEKDACYSKVKSRYKVWPSAYASGALVRCRKVGAKNWGNKSKK